MRAEAQAIDRDLGQPFFAWLSEREGADGRPIGVGGALRLASPQTPEDAEELRGHAANFIAERFPQPAGPDPSSIGGRTEYGTARDKLSEAYTGETDAAYGGWSETARDRARSAGAPAPGEVEAGARRERAKTQAQMMVSEAGREARAGMTVKRAGQGRAGIEAETGRPFGEHAAGEVPVIGGWLAGKLYGTAKNTAPDAPGQESHRGPRAQDGREP